MRLHALILAGPSGAPLAALSDDPKVRACAAGLASPCQDLDQPGEVQGLLGAWTGVLDHPLPEETLHRQHLGSAVHRDLLERLRG